MSSATSSAVINLRTPPAQRELIDRAARLQGKSRTDFMLEASREKAEQVLLDQALFTVNAKQYKAFVALMDAPLSENPALKRLLAKRAPWEKSPAHQSAFRRLRRSLPGTTLRSSFVSMTL